MKKRPKFEVVIDESNEEDYSEPEKLIAELILSHISYTGSEEADIKQEKRVQNPKKQDIS